MLIMMSRMALPRQKQHLEDAANHLCLNELSAGRVMHFSSCKTRSLLHVHDSCSYNLLSVTWGI